LWLPTSGKASLWPRWASAFSNSRLNSPMRVQPRSLISNEPWSAHAMKVLTAGNGFKSTTVVRPTSEPPDGNGQREVGARCGFVAGLREALRGSLHLLAQVVS